MEVSTLFELAAHRAIALDLKWETDLPSAIVAQVLYVSHVRAGVVDLNRLDRKKSFGGRRKRGENRDSFSVTYGIGLDKVGNVYVVDRGGHRVVVFKRSKGKYTVIRVVNESRDANILKEPVGLSVKRDGEIAVCSRSDACVVIFDAHGVLKTRLTHKDMKTPSGCAFDGTEQTLAVVDDASDKVFVFHRLKFAFSFSHPKMNRPRGICVDRRGGWLVSCENQVIRFDAKGRFVNEFTWLEDLPPPKARIDFGKWKVLSSPRCVAVDRMGKVFSASYGGDVVCVWNAEGKPLAQFGRRGDEVGGFYGPRAICISPDGVVFVAGGGNCRVHTFGE